MEPIIWVVIAVVLVLVVVGVVVAARARSRAQLRERFGPEYDRVVERTGSRKEADQELAEVAHKRDELEIRDLDPASRARRTQEWQVVQARFVDEPAEAVGAASTLVTAVLEERGYPVEDFDEQASLVAADHPDVVQHYRDAQAAYDRHQKAGEGDTEDLRVSFVHYRKLFDALVHPDATPSSTSSSAPSSSGADITDDDATPASGAPVTDVRATDYAVDLDADPTSLDGKEARR